MSNVAREAFSEFAKKCPHRVSCDPRSDRRRGNHLNIEHVMVFPIRCLLKRPKHWPENVLSARWIMSGGNVMVFGRCSMTSCALGHEWCPECGHRKESHMADLGKHGCPVTGEGFPCGCEHYAQEHL